MANQVNIDVRLVQKDEDDDTTATGNVKCRVALDDGTPASEATVELAAADGSLRQERQPDALGGSVTFSDVPVQSYTVTITRSGYKTMTIDLTADDFGGPEIVRGYDI